MATPQIRRPRRVVPLVDIEKQFLLFLNSWRTATVAGTDRDRASKIIKAWFEKGGDGTHEITQNDTGSLSVEFEDPIMLPGVTAIGLENVRRESSVLDEDALDELLDTLDEKDRKRVAKRVTVIEYDQDELFALQQEGKISEAQLDGLFTTTVTWALTVKKQ